MLLCQRTQPHPLTSSSFLICNGDSATLTASSGNTYVWSNGATTPSITVSSSDNYRVTVTNGIGCTSTSSYVEVIESDFTSSILFFTESMDTAVGTTSIAIHEANNGFDNDNFYDVRYSRCQADSSFI